VIDNRVTLPLDKAERVIDFACGEGIFGCDPSEHGGSEHGDGCLVPNLTERERMLKQDREKGRRYGVSDDCASGKHDPICNGTGCECACHPRRKT
jgi:hypothetical protein